jgi:hypothetical protein
MTTATGWRQLPVAVDRDSGRLFDLKLFDVTTPQCASLQLVYVAVACDQAGPRLRDIQGARPPPSIQRPAVLWERQDFECNHFRGRFVRFIRRSALMHFDGSDPSSSWRSTSAPANRLATGGP